jgi:hypothetical protein
MMFVISVQLFLFMIGEVVNGVLIFMLYIVFSFEMKECCLFDASKFDHVYSFYDMLLFLAR